MINIISFKTKFGWITAKEFNKKIYEIKFGKTKNILESKILNQFKNNLTKFLNKKVLDIAGTYSIEGNKNQRKVWNELKKIKPGKTKTYKEVAKKFNFSPRYVGKICGQNKLALAIPCHRVIRSDGSMGGYSAIGGIKLKKKLLNFEKNWK